HRALADGVRAAVEAWASPSGLSLLVGTARDRANSVTTVLTGSIDATELSRRCREQLGVTLGVGIGDLADRSFRIGHMGHVNAPMVLGVLGAVDVALATMGAPVRRSGVAAASASLAAALGRNVA
ncbi:MAG: aminotransferase, partial [Ilumatobacteraceae bacterium]